MPWAVTLRAWGWWGRSADVLGFRWEYGTRTHSSRTHVREEAASVRLSGTVVAVHKRAVHRVGQRACACVLAAARGGGGGWRGHVHAPGRP